MTANNAPWIIVLAAGASSRYGSIKALAPWRGGTLLSATVETAREVVGENIMVVTGAYAQQLESELNTHVIYNARWQTGMGSSISEGVDAVLRLAPLVEIIVITPVDQPLISAGHLHELIRLVKHHDCPALSSDENVKGPPAAFPSQMFKALRGLINDHGFKQILKDTQIVDLKCTGILRDADTPDQLAILSATFA